MGPRFIKTIFDENGYHQARKMIRYLVSSQFFIIKIMMPKLNAVEPESTDSNCFRRDLKKADCF